MCSGVVSQLPTLVASDPNKGYNPTAGCVVWAYTTYPVDSDADAALEVGGIETGLTIDFS